MPLASIKFSILHLISPAMDTSRVSCEPNKDKQIAIIGAGISGLLACKHAMEKGFNPLVFESRSCIGGAWSATIDSTRLQTPKEYFQFSDFPWPDTVSDTFPDHNQVMDYITSYARHFNIFERIKFDSKVVTIDYLSSSCGGDDRNLDSWSMWGGGGGAFSTGGRWSVVVEDCLHPMEPPKVYRVNFVILCIGKFSDVPYIPEFPKNKGDNVFNGEVMHSMDYAAMDKIQAKDFVKNKRVTVVGFQKSAVDTANEIANYNGVKYPCTLVLRRVKWTGSENLVRFTFRNLNRFSELMVHKPAHEGGLLFWLLAVFLFPLRRIFSKLVECYLKWIYPLRNYDMVPKHGFLKQISSCMFMVLPQHFYERVKEGSLVLRKSRVLGFSENGLLLDNAEAPLATDIVIFATGYKSDEKLANIFTSVYFKKCIIGSSAPFYRECIHPRIPQLAILGYSESPATLFTFELRSKWLSHFLAGKFILPPIKEMEEEVMAWEKLARSYSQENYRRACVGVMLQIYCNDKLCKDMGCNPRRKKWFFQEMFSTYQPKDYANV